MIQPVGSRILVEPKLVEDKTAEGILLPTVKNQTQQVGTVTALGTGRILENGEHLAPVVQVGDEIIFAKFAGTPVQYEGQNYFILDERDILARVPR
jgi:chaperonin GroES